MHQYFNPDWIIGDYGYISEEDMDERWWYTDYQNVFISDHGRVFNGNTGNFLKPKPMDKTGHLGVMLRIDGKDFYVYVHRLMAKAFIPNPNGHPIVRHLDDEKWNNDIQNLSWGTMKDNSADCIRNGHAHFITPEEREIGMRKIRKPVIVINLRNREQLYFRSLNEACRSLGVQQANASKVLAGKRVHTQGYFFEYVKTENKDD